MDTMQAYQQYRTMQAQTADRGELVVMLYEGAIKFLVRASAALEAGNMQDTHNNVIRSQDIIVQLMGSLNMDAGEVAQNLYRMYEYMYHRLVQANVKKDPKGIREATQLLRELLPTWQGVAKEARAPKGETSPAVTSALRYIAV